MIRTLFDKLTEDQQACIIELMIAMTDHPTTSPLRAIGEAKKLYGSNNTVTTMEFTTISLRKYNEMKQLPNKR